MQIDKRNLAVALEDEAVREAYLYPEKADTPALIRMILSPLRGDKKLIAMWLLHGVAYGIRPVLSVFILGWFVGMLERGAPAGQFLGVAAAVALVYFVLSAAVTQSNSRVRVNWMVRRVSLINRMMSQYMRMDFGLFENARFQDAMNRWGAALGGNEAGLEGIWNRSLEGFGRLLSLVVLGGVLLWFLGPWLLVPVVLYIVIIWLTKSNIAKYRFERREELTTTGRKSNRYTKMATDFRYGKDSRMYKMQDRFAAGFKPLITSYQRLYHAFTGREFHWTWLENTLLIGVEFTLLALLFFAQLPPAQFVPVLTASLLFGQALQQFSLDIAYYQSESVYIEDAFALLQADLQSEDGNAVLTESGPVEITLENVSFSYPGSDVKVLEDCSLTLYAGSSCALVGVNGAGKTTLVKLITGLYRPTRGTIRINGTLMTELSSEQIFGLYGAVFQDAQPLAITIAEFVAADDLEIDRDRVRKSLSTAGLLEKVESFEKGIDSPLLKVLHDDGVILSGGENQKLAIARALYRENTRALILDEPTSALDALAEEKIYREFAELAEGRTTLFISHRLASTRFCDRIAVLSGGRIVQEGTHNELMHEDRLYRTMYETQAKYYQEAGE